MKKRRPPHHPLRNELVYPDIEDPKVLAYTKHIIKNFVYKIEYANPQSLEIHDWFHDNTDWDKDPSAQIAYEHIYNVIGSHPKFWELIHDRCDHGERKPGLMASSLYLNREIPIMKRQWAIPSFRDCFAGLVSGISSRIGFGYDGLDPKQYVIFVRDEDRAGNPDFYFYDLITGEKLGHCESKDGASMDMQTYKLNDLENLIKYQEKTGLPLFILTALLDKKISKTSLDNIIGFAIHEIEDIKNILNGTMSDGTQKNTIFPKCPWLGWRSVQVLGNVENNDNYTKGGTRYWKRITQYFGPILNSKDANKILRPRLLIKAACLT